MPAFEADAFECRWRFSLNVECAVAFDSAEVFIIAGGEECDGVAVCSRACGASDAVDVFIGCFGNVIVVDVRDVFDVEAACCDVCCDKDVNVFVFECVERVAASALGESAVDGHGSDAVHFEIGCENVHFVASATEDEGKSLCVLAEQVNKQREFIVRRDIIINLFEQVFCDVDFALDRDRLA